MDCAFTTCALHWRHVIDAVTSQRTLYNLSANAKDYPCARLRSFYCIVGDHTPCLWRQYGHPLHSFRTPWQGPTTTFVLSMLKVQAIVVRSMWSHSVYWKCHCVAAEMLAILLHLPQNSTFEPHHEISNNVVCATSKASDQPAHTRSLFRAFASRLNIYDC